MQKDEFSPAPIETTNAVPVSVPVLVVPPDSMVNLSLVLNARTPTGVAAAFRMYRAIKRIGTGSAAFVGLLNVPMEEKDLGASAWLATLSLSGANVMLTVTGALATQITWTIAGECLVSR